MRRILIILLTLALLCPLTLSAGADGSRESLDVLDDAELDTEAFSHREPLLTGDAITIAAPSAILMEKSSGRVLYEKDADTPREPASVTKVMTILLIVEAIEANTVALDDPVTCSARAASMGGSQVFLEEGEQMSVHEMLKAIVVASANDAAVPMAEHLAGTEEAFVERMNRRAAELGMENTRFTNCTGLMDDPEHVTTARDIAIMSRELICHEMIKAYTTIWMDTIRSGEFGLSNTNKLIYYYEGATGLKTGFTSRAMYCLSATAEREGVEYIAVVLHGETSQQRFEDAKTLLSYGFANYTAVPNEPEEILRPVPVKLGRQRYVQPVLETRESLLVEKGAQGAVERKVELPETLTAPVEKGQVIGTLTVTAGGEILGRYELKASDSVGRLRWTELFGRVLRTIFAGG
jgi:D-alanyl-D-alanine carboxypeptidase (penicillin-binding protein 5/6)